MHFVTDDMGSMIELYNNPIAPMPNYEEINPFNLHFAFSSSDIEADSARLQAAGARLHAPISSTPAGDIQELKAVRTVFEGKSAIPVIGSTKSLS